MHKGGYDVLTMVQWMNRIRKNYNCSQYIHSLMDVIYSHMLCLNSKDRLESKDLLLKIQEMEEQRMTRSAHWKDGCSGKISEYANPDRIRTQFKAGFGDQMPIRERGVGYQ